MRDERKIQFFFFFFGFFCFKEIHRGVIRGDRTETMLGIAGNG